MPYPNACNLKTTIPYHFSQDTVFSYIALSKSQDVRGLFSSPVFLNSTLNKRNIEPIHRFHMSQNRYNMAVTVTVSIIFACICGGKGQNMIR
jgi:hypothetical protein